MEWRGGNYVCQSVTCLYSKRPKTELSLWSWFGIESLISSLQPTESAFQTRLERLWAHPKWSFLRTSTITSGPKCLYWQSFCDVFWIRYINSLTLWLHSVSFSTLSRVNQLLWATGWQQRPQVSQRSLVIVLLTSYHVLLHHACHVLTNNVRETRHFMERSEKLPGRAVLLMPICTLQHTVLSKQCFKKIDKTILEFFCSGC